MKRLLFLLHRWLGIGVCLFMLLWFVSGIVMLYVGYPKLTQSERLQRLPVLETSQCCISVAQAAQALPGDSKITAITLTSIAGHPQYHFASGKKIVAVDARTGQAVNAVSPQDAVRAAQAFMPEGAASYLDRIDEDAWSHSRGLDQHRPLHRVQMDDVDQTLLYVSSMTGEVVRKATRTERIWNYVGTWLHWLYAFRGGPLDGAWNGIVVYSSLIGVLVALSGSIVGISRWRFRGRFRSGAKTPYRESFMRWHHLTGLAFALFAITWVFSGLMSMNPWGLFKSTGPAMNKQAYAGASLQPANWPLDSRAALQLLSESQLQPQSQQQSQWQVKELRWQMLAGHPYLMAINGNGKARVIDAQSRVVSTTVPQEKVMQAAAKLYDSPIAETTLLQREDAYYYSREPHTMMGGTNKPLPVLRIRYGDAADTWVHIDPATGVILDAQDRLHRIKRWLFAFLHSWDLPVLLATQAWWYLAMTLLSIGGVLLSATGVMIGIRRLRQ